jgi:hypothetical protein
MPAPAAQPASPRPRVRAAYSTRVPRSHSEKALVHRRLCEAQGLLTSCAQLSWPCPHAGSHDPSHEGSCYFGARPRRIKAAQGTCAARQSEVLACLCCPSLRLHLSKQDATRLCIGAANEADKPRSARNEAASSGEEEHVEPARGRIWLWRSYARAAPSLLRRVLPRRPPPDAARPRVPPARPAGLLPLHPAPPAGGAPCSLSLSVRAGLGRARRFDGCRRLGGVAQNERLRGAPRAGHGRERSESLRDGEVKHSTPSTSPFCMLFPHPHGASLSPLRAHATPRGASRAFLVMLSSALSALRDARHAASVRFSGGVECASCPARLGGASSSPRLLLRRCLADVRGDCYCCTEESCCSKRAVSARRRCDAQ